MGIDQTSKLLTHLYEFFGALLGCQYISRYAGFTSMYNVHKFMNLNTSDIGYFIQEVGYAALSFGVDPNDLVPVAQTLGDLFGQRCTPPISVLGGSVPAELQSICIDPGCATAPNGTCAVYATPFEPMLCNRTYMSTSNCTSSTGSSGPQASATVVQSVNLASRMGGDAVLWEFLVAFLFVVLL